MLDPEYSKKIMQKYANTLPEVYNKTELQLLDDSINIPLFMESSNNCNSVLLYTSGNVFAYFCIIFLEYSGSNILPLLPNILLVNYGFINLSNCVCPIA